MAEEEERRLGAEADHGAHVGTVCHRVLQEMDFSRAKAEVKALLDGALRELPAGADAAAVARDARAILASFVSSDLFRRIRSARIVGREVPILYPAGDEVLAGRIDLIYEEDGAVVVADYKTDRAASGEALRERYAGQLRYYMEAIRGVLPGRPVRGALVWLPQGELVPVPTVAGPVGHEGRNTNH